MEKALVANSVRDFEKSISMISYGFEAVEDFYAKSSTRNVVGKVKIPVLFIQVHILFVSSTWIVNMNTFTTPCLTLVVVARSSTMLAKMCKHFNKHDASLYYVHFNG